MDDMDKILIIDFGSQVTQLIARKVRESGVYCEILPCTHDFDDIKNFGAKGIILSGGPASVTADESPEISAEIFEFGLPVLGICYGQQLMCKLLGGVVEGSETREFGRAHVTILQQSAVFSGVWPENSEHQVWMSHGDKVTKLPSGFVATAKTDSAPYAAIANEAKNFYGFQFHPEVIHTPDGADLIKNFTHNICGCSGDWTMQGFLQTELEKVRAQVGSKKVICAASGGVDSSVVAALLNKAIGDQLHCIFVDTGLLRYKEAEQVKDMFKNLGVNLNAIDARDEFLGELDGVSDPEEKRKIIGKKFIEIFEREANKLPDAEFLAQGTLYPDVIESVSFKGPSATIKSHHNVGGLPERMNLQLVEPLRELFKDEVRELGMQLGIPENMIRRHPFPGPGLAIRIPGEITQEKIDILQRADNIYIELLKEHNLYNEIWQAFCVLLPVKTVGVMGDARTYEYVLGVRAVTSTDGMTADYYPMSHEFLSKLATKIINEVKGVNRVVYDITSKPPGTIEWE